MTRDHASGGLHRPREQRPAFRTWYKNRSGGKYRRGRSPLSPADNVNSATIPADSQHQRPASDGGHTPRDDVCLPEHRSLNLAVTSNEAGELDDERAVMSAEEANDLVNAPANHARNRDQSAPPALERSSMGRGLFTSKKIPPREPRKSSSGSGTFFASRCTDTSAYWNHRVDAEMWIRNFMNFRKEVCAAFKQPGNRVRVTIIDTGIDGEHPFILKRGWKKTTEDNQKSLFADFTNEPKKKTTPGDDKKNTPRDDPVDTDDHGTFISGLLLRLHSSEYMELSVARIAEDRESCESDNNFNEKVAKAINHAVVEWQSEIISLSLSCKNKNGSVEDAVKDAVKKGTIIFAATGNEGYNRDHLPYPASEDGVFRIFGTTPQGKPSPTASYADRSGLSFFTLGGGIRSAWPTNIRHDHSFDPGSESPCHETGGCVNHMDGSSFSTPIAAAFAILLFHYANSMGDEEKKAFKSHKMVKCFLMAMCNPNPDLGYNYLNPPPAEGVRRPNPKFLPPEEYKKQLDIFLDKRPRPIKKEKKAKRKMSVKRDKPDK